MTRSAKHFAEKLNHCLDELGAPIAIRERTSVLSKMLDISKHQAWGLIEGQQIPDRLLLQKIANDFEVDLNWLLDEK